MSLKKGFVVVIFIELTSFYLTFVLINSIIKHFVTLLCYSDSYPTLLFGPILLGTFANVPPYSVVRAYSVSDFEKCATLFRYISLCCYLELQSKLIWTGLYTCDEEFFK